MCINYTYSNQQLQYRTELLYHLHAILKLAINCALNTVSNGAAKLKVLNVELFNVVRYFSTTTTAAAAIATTITTTASSINTIINV